MYIVSASSRLPYFAEVAYFAWGDVDYDSEGDCESPRDREWSELQLVNRDSDDWIDVESTALKEVSVRASSKSLAAKAALIVAIRAAGEVEPNPMAVLPMSFLSESFKWAAFLSWVFSCPDLLPFDRMRYWDGWKWLGSRASSPLRHIIDSVVHRDARAVYDCIQWGRYGATDGVDEEAITSALSKLTSQYFPTLDEWLYWYYEGGGIQEHPEPDRSAWLADIDRRMRGFKDRMG